MKITRNRLKEIIREELQRTDEADRIPIMYPSDMGIKSSKSYEDTYRSAMSSLVAVQNFVSNNEQMELLKAAHLALQQLGGAIRRSQEEEDPTGLPPLPSSPSDPWVKG